MAQIVIGENAVRYRKLFKQYEIPIEDIIWAYLQQEDVNATMCCGKASFPIGRLVLLNKNGQKEVFQYEGLDEPRKLLNALIEKNPRMAVGYTEENKKRFMG